MRDMVRLDGPQGASPTHTLVPFILDSQRILVDLAFVRPDGSERKALAWLNMGVSGPVLSSRLYRELAVTPTRDLRLRIGDLSVAVNGTTVTDGPGHLSGDDDFDHFFKPQPVEAILPAGVLQQFEVVLDYGARQVTLAQPSSLKPEGIAVPFRLNVDTGLITVDARIAEAQAALVVDAGAPYTWIRGDAASPWLAAHPDWHRADGAVGQSNAAMVDFALEQRGTVIRIPEIDLGDLQLRDVGALATAPLIGTVGDRVFGNLFWDTWQKNAPEPVVGWIGANVLRDFKVTIDYATRTLYLLRQRAPEPHDLDQVGLTLISRSGDYFIGGIVTKDGVPTVAGAEIGDRLAAVDGRPMRGESRDVVLDALAGAGVHHVLTLDRGSLVEIDVVGSAF